MSGTTDLENYLQGQTDSVGSSAANTRTAVTQMARVRRIVYPKWSGALGTCTDDAMASTTTAEQQMGSIEVAGTVTSIVYVPNGTITADAANNAVITVSKRTSAGGSLTTLGTLTTDLTLGSLVAGQAASFTLTATVANRSFTAGSTLNFSVAKNGTGVVTRNGCFVVTYTED